jgi:hypothetical protein
MGYDSYEAEMERKGGLVVPEREVWPCDCECHKPAGWAWRRGDPRPTNFRACGKCDYIQHMAPTAEQLAWELGPKVVAEAEARAAAQRAGDPQQQIAYLEGRIETLQAKLAETAHLPNLGLASTESLFREIISRLRITGDPMLTLRNIDKVLVLAELLGSLEPMEREYRTVDHG